MFGVDLKRIASASGLSSVFGLGGPSASEKPSASERPRNSDGAGPSAGGREEEEEEGASHEKTATTNLISAGHESFELIFMMLMGIRTSVGRFCAQAQARELASSDFEQQWEGDFLGKGSESASSPSGASKEGGQPSRPLLTLRPCSAASSPLRNIRNYLAEKPDHLEHSMSPNP